MLSNFAEFFEREAGQVAVGLIVMAIGVSLWYARYEHAGEIVTTSLGWIGRSMCGGKK